MAHVDASIETSSGGRFVKKEWLENKFMDILTVGIEAAARIILGVFAWNYALNFAKEVNVFAMALSWTIVMTVLRGLVWLKVWYWRTPNDNDEANAARRLTSYQFLEWVLYVAWFWRWQTRHGGGINKDSPPTSGDEGFASVLFLMGTLSFLGIVSVTLSSHYMFTKAQKRQDSLLNPADPVVMRVDADANIWFYFYYGCALACYGLAVVYTGSHFFTTVGISAIGNLYVYFGILMAITGMWVFMMIFHVIYYTQTKKGVQFPKTYWAEVVSNSVFLFFWIFYNIVWFINASDKGGGSTSNPSRRLDDWSKSPNFDGVAFSGGFDQSRLYITWQVFAVCNGVSLLFIVYGLTSFLTYSSEIMQGKTKNTINITLEQAQKCREEFDPKNNWIRLYIAIALIFWTFLLLHMLFCFSDLLEEYYLNNRPRMKIFAAVYTAISALFVVFLTVYTSFKIFDSNKANMVCVMTMRNIITLTTFYFMGIFMYWYPILDFTSAEFSRSQLVLGLSEAQFVYWNMMAHHFLAFFIVTLTLVELFQVVYSVILDVSTTVTVGFGGDVARFSSRARFNSSQVTPLYTKGAFEDDVYEPQMASLEQMFTENYGDKDQLMSVENATGGEYSALYSNLNQRNNANISSDL